MWLTICWRHEKILLNNLMNSALRMAAVFHIIVFRAVLSYSLVGGYWRFEGALCFCLQGLKYLVKFTPRLLHSGMLSLCMHLRATLWRCRLCWRQCYSEVSSTGVSTRHLCVGDWTPNVLTMSNYISFSNANVKLWITLSLDAQWKVHGYDACSLQGSELNIM
jgi:hypothetical protein